MSETRPTPEDLAALDARIDAIKADLRAAEKARQAAHLALWGVEFGSLVRETKGRTPRLGQIASVEHVGGAQYRPWVNVRLTKKDGSIGDRCVNFYSEWETVDTVSPKPSA